MKKILIRKKLEKIFGIKDFTEGLYYKFAHVTRCNLGSGKSRLERFILAWDKFNKIFQSSFKKPDKIDVVLDMYDNKGRENRIPKGLQMLKECGFTIPKKHHRIRIIYTKDKTETVYSSLYYFSLRKNSFKVKSIIWAILGSDMGIKPTAKVAAYFIDFKRKILIHPYDDRGCDIIKG